MTAAVLCLCSAFHSSKINIYNSITNQENILAMKLPTVGKERFKEWAEKILIGQEQDSKRAKDKSMEDFERRLYLCELGRLRRPAIVWRNKRSSRHKNTSQSNHARQQDLQVNVLQPKLFTYTEYIPEPYTI